MTRLACSLLLLAFVTIAAPSALGANADPSAAVDDIKAAYEKGDYNETLRLISRVLALKGKAAEGLDRIELLRLRAESHLKLKATTNAITALEEAAKAAKTAQDDKAASEARALILLIKRSKNLQFTPKLTVEKGAAKEPIDITDTEKREAALAALYAEEKAAARPKVVAADKTKELPKVATALKEVVPLKDLEIAAKGEDSETAATIKDLVDKAHTLMAKGLDKATANTERIAERANQIVQYTYTRADGGQETRTKRQGIDREDAANLKATINDCKVVFDSCKQLTESFTDDTEPFEDLADQAKQTGQRAHDVLMDNYSRLRN